METKDEKVARLLKRPSSVTGAPLGFFMKMACGNQKPPFFPLREPQGYYNVLSITPLTFLEKT